MTPPVEYITADLGTVRTAVRAPNDAVRHDEALLLLECMRVDNDRARLAVEMAKTEVASSRLDARPTLGGGWVSRHRAGAGRRSASTTSLHGS